MKPKLSLSTIRSMYINTFPYGDLTHKQVVLEILNSKTLLKDYIADLMHDSELIKDDNWPEMISYSENLRKSIKELKSLLAFSAFYKNAIWECDLRKEYGQHVESLYKDDSTHTYDVHYYGYFTSSGLREITGRLFNTLLANYKV